MCNADEGTEWRNLRQSAQSADVYRSDPTPSSDRDFATHTEKSSNHLREQPATQVGDSPASAKHADDATELQP
jgi:hypothetical protein